MAPPDVHTPSVPQAAQPRCARRPHPRLSNLTLFAWAAVLLAMAPLLAAAPVSAQSTAQPLSLDEALELARAYNPGFQATRNEEAVADWELRAARGGLFLPSVGASSGLSWQGSGEERIGGLVGGELGVAGRPTFLFSSYSVGVSYQVSGPGILAPGVARASRQAASARSRRAEAELVLRVTQAWLAFAQQEEALRLARRQMERAQANLDLARGRAEVGAATPLEAMQAEIQVGRAEVAFLEAEQGIRTTRLALIRAIGLDGDRAIRPGAPLSLASIAWNEAELANLALEEAPELQALRASATLASRRVGQARALYLPSLSVQAGWSGFTRQATNDDFILNQVERQAQQAMGQCEFQNELYRRLADPLPTQDCSLFELTEAQRTAALEANRQFPFSFTRQPPSAGVTLSIPLFQGVERRRQVEVARIEEENTRLRLREVEQGLATDVATLVAQARTARALAELEDRNREVAEAQLRLARGEFEVGTGTFLQVAEAETVAAQADRDHLNAVYRYHETLARLQALTGMRLRR